MAPAIRPFRHVGQAEVFTPKVIGSVEKADAAVDLAKDGERLPVVTFGRDQASLEAEARFEG